MVEKVIVARRNGLVIKIAKKEFVWTSSGVKSVIAFNNTLINIDRGTMLLQELFLC